MVTEYKRIEVRAGSPGAWTAANPVLTFGEPGAEISVGGAIRFKVGDGSRTWTQLPYADSVTPTDLDGKVDTAGDTMTGNLTIARDGAVPAVILDSDVTQYAEVLFRKDGSPRWSVRVVNDADADLEFYRFSDAGAPLGQAIRLDRQSGVLDCPNGGFGAPPAQDENSIRFPTSQWVNANWLQQYAVPLRAGFYYRTGANTGALQGGNGQALAQVFVAGRTCSINRVAAEVTAVGSTNSVLRLAIVEVTNPDTMAWTLVQDLGTVASTTTGVKEITTGAAALTQGKLYAACVFPQGAPTTNPTLRYCVPDGHGFGRASAADALVQACSAFAINGVTGAVPASGTGSAISASWATVVRADA